jgi:ATP-dependent RNA helicase DDX35
MAFWKPGTVAPGSTVAVPTKGQSIEDRENEKEGNYVVFNPNSGISLQQQRVRLPIFQNSTIFISNATYIVRESHLVFG